ncbi:MAG: 50S ribosomal protein L11 methyltransferase [Patescibacteria group bacterium]
MDLDETFSSIDLVTQCLTDKKRTDRFEEAIARNVKKGDLVMDSGTGSGILALMAARAGAKKVLAVEYDPYVAKLAVQNVANNDFSDVVDLVVGDARDVNFAKDTVFDVIIMEMLTTGMIDEYQVWTMNNLHKKGYVTAETRLIPQRQDTFIALGEADYTNYGLTMRMVRHVWPPHCTIDLRKLTKTELLNSVSFNTVNPLSSHSVMQFTIEEAGTLNSLYLTSNTILDEQTEVDDTAALNAPVVLPIESDIEVEKGDTVEVTVSYGFGGGFRNFSAHVRKL